MSVIDRIAIKFTSGQFWLTIITGLVFAYVSIKKILPSEAVASIISMVFVFYFKKDREVPTNGQQK